jgi:hypothetical protein
VRGLSSEEVDTLQGATVAFLATISKCLVYINLIIAEGVSSVLPRPRVKSWHAFKLVIFTLSK